MVSLYGLTIASIIRVTLYGLTVTSIVGFGLYPRHFVPRSGEPQASTYTTSLHLSGNRPFIGVLVIIFITFIFHC